MRPELFSNEDHFKQAFAHGLRVILQQADLGCFILACANAFADPVLHRQMLLDIERQFDLSQQALAVPVQSPAQLSSGAHGGKVRDITTSGF